MEYKTSEAKRAREHERYLANREKILDYHRQHHEANKEQRNQYARQYHNAHQEERNAVRSSRTQEYRMVVLQHYAGPNPICACCGETALEFLTLDHPNGGGGQERKTVSRRGQEYYRWLIRHDFPVELRVLCYNCNFSRGQRGYCPHESSGPGEPPTGS